MHSTTEFVIRHGLPLIFAAVFVEQMGLPLPALPWLLAAGALAAIGKFNLGLGLLATVVACLVADAIWFYLGRYRGNQVLGLLCRISLEPDSCVRRAQNVFSKYGLRGVLIAKFVPGVSVLAPPVAGMSGIGAARFLFVDGIGAALYGICLLGFGYLFNRQIDQIVTAIGRIGGSTLSLLVGLVGIYVAYKFWQRQRLLRDLRIARITADELQQKLTAGETIVILDVRSSAAPDEDPRVIQGAVRVDLDQIDKIELVIPHDCDIVVYCSCPNEVSAARTALRLRRKGFRRVRPLLGGIDTWRRLNYPMDSQSGVGALVGAPRMGETERGLRQ